MEQDLEKLHQELERLKGLVFYDHLTGVLNRLGFKEEAEKVLRAVAFGRTAIERRFSFQIPFSIIFLDIDDFKKVNDTYGHQAGDQVLKEVAEVLRIRLRESDVFGRWGGEEFVAALLGANLDATKKVAEDLRAELEKREMVTDGQTIKVTISLGVAGYGHEKNLEEIISKADQAMYQAKHAGKNRVVVNIDRMVAK